MGSPNAIDLVARTAATPSFRLGASPSVLAHATRLGVDVAVWTRGVPEAVRDALAAWTASAPPSLDRPLSLRSSIASVRRTASTCCPLGAVLATVPVEARRWLCDDVSLLLERFGAVAHVEQAHVFFGVIRDDQCRKFHVDAVHLRLVTTYVGPGTEWVPSEAVDRDALARLTPCPSEANAGIVRIASAVRRAEPGHVLVLKGGRNASAAGAGAVHRSPAIAHRGEARVTLVVTAGGTPST